MKLLLMKCFQLSIIIIECQLLLADQTVGTQISEGIWDEDHELESNCTLYKSSDDYQTKSRHKPSQDSSRFYALHRCGGRIGTAENFTEVTVSGNARMNWAKYHLKGIGAAPNDTKIVPCEQLGLHSADKLANAPKKTLTLNHNMTKNRGFYACDLYIGGVEFETVMIDVRIRAKPETLSKPTIEKHSAPYTVRGTRLVLLCAEHMEHAYWVHEIEWITPKKNVRIPNQTVKDYEKRTQPLVIDNVTAEDEGLYTCIVRVSNFTRSASMHIKINDPNSNFIKLKPALDDKDYTIAAGSNVNWVVEYEGHPHPTFEWLNPQNRNITNGTSKYIINKTAADVRLTIKNLELSDIGVYTLAASSGHIKPQVTTRLYNLTVLSKPLPKNNFKIKDYYELNETVEFTCTYEGYPRPSIVWNFQEYLHDSSEYRAPEIIKPYAVNEGHVRVISTVRIHIRASGNLSCDAHNAYGSDSYQYSILIADVPNGFGIIAPQGGITVDDDVKLVCRASIYNFKDSFQWRFGSKPLGNDSITQNRTPFSYESILQIKGIDTSYNNIDIACDVSTHDGKTSKQNKRLTVKVPVKPYFTNTNMNGNEYLYDAGTASTIIKLKCYVSGKPRPVLSWFKDGKVLNATEDLYQFVNDKRELEIIHPRASDSGEYTCRAKNRVDTIEVHQKITIRDGVSKTVIISIVILLTLSVILVVYFSIKIHRAKIMRKQLMDAGIMHFEEGALKYLNPELTVEDQADLLPYDRKWEFPRERLKFGRQLGSGAFGVVMKAQAERICRNELSTTVAVKMVRRSTESTYIRALVSELKIMVHLGKHLNVVNLLGACTRNIAKHELLVIVEYCRYGNLHNYLLRHRSDFINQIDRATRKIDLSIGRELLMKPDGVGIKNSGSTDLNIGSELVNYVSGDDIQDSTSMAESMHDNDSAQPGWRSNYNGDYENQSMKPICTQDLLSWAFQVARGMEYLCQRKILHGDLAARNILLAENGIVKICDFGLARSMYKDENYEKKGDALLPIKWMAIESIRDRVFSTQSDVWSFGIVLWEFFSLAETPYIGIGAEAQYQKLIEGYRMTNPEYSPDDIYEIMLKCWEATPSARPTFTDLVQSIGDLLDENVKTHYLDLNNPYVDMNAKSFRSEESDYLTMMSAPDHGKLSSYRVREYVNLPNIPVMTNSDCSFKCDIPPNSEDVTNDLSMKDALKTKLSNSPVPQPKSGGKFDFEKVIVEPSTVVKIEADNYLKPINVQERRAVFVQQQQDEMDDNMNIVENNSNESMDKNNFNDLMRNNIKAQDNHVNMPNKIIDLKIGAPNCFANRSYLFMENMESEDSRL